MNLRHMPALLLSFVILGHTVAVDSAESKWAAFSAISGVNKWFVVTGSARVVMSKEAFMIEMFDDDGNVLLIVNGRVRGGELHGVAVWQESDDSPRRMRGRYKSMKWRDGPGGREAILLTEVNEPMGLTLGVMKERP